MKPPTPEQWRAWNATADRNWTDEPIGTASAGKRSVDALASRHVSDTDQDAVRRTTIHSGAREPHACNSMAQNRQNETRESR